MNSFRDARVLTEADLTIALAFVLGLIKIFQMRLVAGVAFLRVLEGARPSVRQAGLRRRVL